MRGKVTQNAPRRARTRTKTVTRAQHPHDVTVLGIDTARVSGYSLRVRGKLTHAGQIDTTSEDRVQNVLQLGIATAGKYCSRYGMVVVLEKPWGGSTPVLVGLGMARERWMRACARASFPRSRIVSVTPNTWRSAVFGAAWLRAGRDLIREHEMRTALAEVPAGVVLGDDEATAICISYWGAYAREVAYAAGMPVAR